MIFSGKLSLSLLYLEFEPKTSGSVIEKRSTLIEEQLTKVVFTSNDLIFDIVFLILNKISKISRDNFQQGCQYCNLRVKMNNLSRKIFSSKKLSFSNILGVKGLRFCTSSAKKIRIFRTAFNVSGGKTGWKIVFVWFSFNFTHLFGL